MLEPQSAGENSLTPSLEIWYKYKCGVEQSGSSSGSVDTKLKADVAESSVVTELLKRVFRVLKPVGDRLPYDLALDCDGKFLRIQVKSAWYERLLSRWAARSETAG